LFIENSEYFRSKGGGFLLLEYLIDLHQYW